MRPAVVLVSVFLAVLVAGAAAGESGKKFTCGTTGVGRVVSSIQPDVAIDGEQATGKPGLYACADVATDKGSLHFKLTNLGVDCHVTSHSEVVVEPDRDTLVEFDDGLTKCTTARKFKKKKFRAGSQINLNGDPLFSVRVGRKKQVAVNVASGFLQMGKNNVIVGPKQEALAVGSTVNTPQPLDAAVFTSLKQSNVAAGLPKPQLSRPKAGRSKTLARIYARRRVIVGLAGGANTGRGTLRFVRRYFAFLSHSWNLRQARIKVIGPGQNAGRLLTSRTIDIYVTPRPPKRTQAQRLFFDKSGRRWDTTMTPDPVFFASLDRFVRASLDTGDYATRYDSAFRRRSPTYGLLRTLVFPKLGCTPQPGANLTSPFNLSLSLVSRPFGAFPGGSRVLRTATVTNWGPRNLDCVAIHFSVFSTSLVGTPSFLPASACHPDETTEKVTAGELRYTCEVGPIEAGQSASASMIGQPTRTPPKEALTPQTCAIADAQESGGTPEANLGDNGQCAQIVYRKTSLVVGAADDTMKASTVDDAKRRFERLTGAGLGAAVISEHWSLGETAPGPNEATELKATAQAAELERVPLYLVVYNRTAKDTPLDGPARANFGDYVAALLEIAPAVKYVIVGNEPNNGLYWAPQYDDAGQYVAAAAYESLLVETYDRLKRVSDVTVLGGALAPRGSDTKPPRGRATRSPKTFITDLGRAFRADVQNGRTAPIMDGFAFHPIPTRPTVPPSATHPLPLKSLGIGDYPELVALLGNAFGGSGTGQKGADLPIYYTEYGVETLIRPRDGNYTGTQQIKTATTEEKQGASYVDAIQLASCQPTVAALFLFHLVDDQDFSRWQSGLYHLNGKKKSDFGAVAQAARTAQRGTIASCQAAPQTPTQSTP